MPSLRDPVINLPALHVRPTQTQDSIGNAINNGPDAPVAATGGGTGECLVGVIPSTLQKNPYLVLHGQDADINARRWLVAAIGATTLVEGDAIVVSTGQRPGTYRAQVVNPTPPGEQIVLAECLKE